MARRRYQKGSLFLRGKEPVWVGRWLEDIVQPDGSVVRKHRAEILGTLQDFPTKRLAQRQLDTKLAYVNSLSYRPFHSVTFREFSVRWQEKMMSQHKLSSQYAERQHINCYLLPFFGSMPLRRINLEMVQDFVACLHRKPLKPKTVRNVYATLRLMFRTAEAWGCVPKNSIDFSWVRLPEMNEPHQVCLLPDQVRAVIEAAGEPFRTMFAIVAETGMRGGEVCGILLSDLDLQLGVITLRHSSWRGKLQSPKSKPRIFRISPELSEHVLWYIETAWQANSCKLLFANRNLQPYNSRHVVDVVLKPILRKLNLPQCGLHAFRHVNATVQDQNRIPIKVRQERLGHVSFEDMTLGRYTHAMSEDHRVAASVLGKIFCSNLAQLRVDSCATITKQRITL